MRRTRSNCRCSVRGEVVLNRDLTILIPVINESANLKRLLPELKSKLEELVLDAKVVVVDGGSTDDSMKVAEGLGAEVMTQSEPGYGNALLTGFSAANTEYVLTMDADYSHEPSFIRSLWQARENGDLIIASRYVSGGKADMSFLRSTLSRALNFVYRNVLDLSYRDLSSGFRLYRSSALRQVEPVGRDFDFLPELLVRMHADGYRILEVPFHYRPRRDGESHAKLLKFGWAFVRTMLRMRKLRN